MPRIDVTELIENEDKINNFNKNINNLKRIVIIETIIIFILIVVIFIN